MSEVSQGRLKEDAERRKPDPSDTRAYDQLGGQKHPLDDEKTLDESLEETFPASDPVPAKQIDGSNN